MVRSTITRQANRKITAVAETRTASAGKFGSEENVIIAVLLKGGLKAMDNLGVAGILQTYAEKARNAKTRKATGRNSPPTNREREAEQRSKIRNRM